MGMPATVYASQARQQRPSQCYQCTLAVLIVNVIVGGSGFTNPPNTNSASTNTVSRIIQIQIPPSLIHQFPFAINPTQLATGTPFIIQFRVAYPIPTNPAGYPVTLSPDRSSFSFTNSSGASYLLDGVAVNPVPNQPGNYTYASTVTSDFPQGAVTAAVVEGSLQDDEGNIGPSWTIASHNSQAPLDQTPSLYDNSILTIGPAPVAPPPSSSLNNLPPVTFPSVILALILLTLILQVKIRRGRTKSRKD
jgi:hypothetical protein